MIKMLRGVRMAALRATTKHTRLLPAAPNAISSANSVIRIVWSKQHTTHFCVSSIHIPGQICARTRICTLLTFIIETTLRQMVMLKRLTTQPNPSRPTRCLTQPTIHHRYVDQTRLWVWWVNPTLCRRLELSENGLLRLSWYFIRAYQVTNNIETRRRLAQEPLI